MSNLNRDLFPQWDALYLSRLRANLAYELYQDFQGYIHSRFGWPTSIIMREPDGSVRRCFPKDRYRGFCTFCRELRQSSSSRGESVCVQEGNEYVRQGIEAEARGESWEWGWRRCHMGLLDLFIPIRSAVLEGEAHPILAVLSVGHYRNPDQGALNYLHDRIDEATLGPDWQTYFPAMSEDQRRQHAERLHRSANQVKMADDETRKNIQSDLSEAVALMEFIATRTLHQGILLQGDEFIRGLGLDKVPLHVGEEVLWREVQSALEQIVDYLPVVSAVLYASSQSDYTDVQRKILLPTHLDVSESIGFPSYEDVRQLTRQSGLSLPTEIDGFWWLDPKIYLGADAAILFAGETATGHVIILGFGHTSDNNMDAFQLAILHQTVRAKIFP